MLLAVAAVDAGLLGPAFPASAMPTTCWSGARCTSGLAWQDETLTRRRWRPYGLAVAGAALLGGLLAWSPFPVNMVGTTGGGVNNTVPPSVALLAFAAVQTGLLLAAEPAVSRLLARAPRLWQRVTWLNDPCSPSTCGT